MNTVRQDYTERKRASSNRFATSSLLDRDETERTQ